MSLTSGRNYLANHVVAPQIIQGTPNYNVEVAEGQVPPGEFYAAAYLPVVQSENRIAGSGFVLMPGKVVCLDENGRLVPAGLVAEIKKARSVAGYTYAGAPTTYGQLSVDNGVINNTGVFVQATDAFVTSNLFSSAASGMNFTMPVGIMRYAALKAPGSDPSNPATFTQHSYDTGGARAFSRWCYIQVPVVETQQRTEAIPAGSQTFRITLYANASGVAISGASLTKKALPNMMTPPAGSVADQFAIVGRTIMFNGPTGAGLSAVYTPDIKTPFCSLVVSSATSPAALRGQAVSYDINSNFVLSSDKIAPHLVGQILDVRSGQNDDLKLVRTYFRDFGLWQEQPGSATDGRNTQLSIANAPKYIARIAVNFETLYQTYTV
jgi:hypothetical protein